MENYNTERIIGNLFSECFHSLVFKSFGIVKDYDVAKDIVQDVFVKIWQNYEKIELISDLKPYVFRAVQNSSFNYLRDHKTNRFSEVPIANSGIECQEESEDIHRKEETYNKIHQAVDKLPEKWREAFILSKYENLKYTEIAEKMNISVKTVEKYISKALNFIRLELKNILLVILSIIFSR
jgi:RNA polymerase sigma-70 factor, ECF subfamily